MTDRLLMTPGPTAILPQVRERMVQPAPNPDMDPAFVDFYRDLLENLASIINTTNDVVILGGEAILGLEAAVGSVLRPEDDVLCISNGVYGTGFARFVEMYGGNPTVHSTAFDSPIDVEGVIEELETGSYTAATMVHCETPTGVLNDLAPILTACQQTETLSIVDAVSSVGGTAVDADTIDICIGGSHKCLSCPPGLTPMTVSDAAWERIRSTPQRSFYASLAPWDGHPKDGELLPYTHLVTNLQGMAAAVEIILNEGIKSVYDRHIRCAERCRSRVKELDLALFPEEIISSPTVTAIHLPGQARKLQRKILEKHNIVVATGIGDLTDDIIRIGHMGSNAQIENVDRAMDAVESVLV